MATNLRPGSTSDGRVRNTNRSSNSASVRRTASSRPNSNSSRTSSGRPVSRGEGRPSSNLERRTDSSSRRTGDSVRRTSDLARRSTQSTRTSSGNSRRIDSSRKTTERDRLRNQSSSSRSSGARSRSNTRPAQSSRSNTRVRPVSREEIRRKKIRNKQLKKYAIILGLAVIAILIFVCIVKGISYGISSKAGIISKAGNIKISKDLLEPNKNTRAEIELDKVQGIVIHDSGQAGKSAAEMKQYYESFAESGNGTESMHFIIDVNGDITQLIPTNEIAFHTLTKNKDCIGIQYCFNDESGAISDASYKSLVALVTKLCDKYDLTIDQVYMHYDVTGKACPVCYSSDSESWNKFLDDVKKGLK